MTCIQCDSPKVENKDLMLCGTCNGARRKASRIAGKPEKKRKPIKRFSERRKSEKEIYAERRPLFLEGKKCAVFPELDAVECHHRKGRQGYADKWAKDNNITLYIDERFWLAVSVEGHREIELNPQWAKDNGFSLSRLENLDQEKVTI